jgi:uncharacterized protein (DUF2147 family)
MKRLMFAAALSLAASVLGVDVALADPSGEWRVADGNATIRIHKCGAGYCGYIASTTGKPGKDSKNPDPAKRNRSVIGVEVLISLKPAGANTWAGTTYNAEDGQIYNAKMTLEGEQALQIQGCVPNGGICGSETWSRVR